MPSTFHIIIKKYGQLVGMKYYFAQLVILLKTISFLWFISRLERIQNQAARILNKTLLRDHITGVLIDLHWLTIEERIV